MPTIERKTTERATHSAYMEWVKTLPAVACNLAISGVKNYPLSGLPVDFSKLALCGPGAYGYRPLVEALAAKCGVAPECVVTAQGTSMANYLAMAALLNPGDEVLVEHPGYSLLWETAEYVGARVRYFERRPELAFTIDLEQLSNQVTPATRLIVLTNLHNPSCVLLNAATLQEIGAIARRVGAHVLVDEVYLDALFKQAPPTSFHLGAEFVVTSSLTKVYGLSGLRCGWVLAEPKLARRMYRIHDFLGVNNPYVTDQISYVALAHLPAIAAWSRHLLETNRKIAYDFLGSTPELKYSPAEWGTVLFPKLPVPVDDFCDLLREKYSTLITPGRFFGAPDYVRIGLGGETAVLSEGLSRVREALDETLSSAESRLSN